MAKFNIQDVIHDLKGTSLNLETVLKDYGKEFSDLSEADRLTLDSEIFCCDCCKWWSDIEEETLDLTTGISRCKDCQDDDNEFDEYL